MIINHKHYKIESITYEYHGPIAATVIVPSSTYVLPASIIYSVIIYKFLLNFVASYN